MIEPDARWAEVEPGDLVLGELRARAIARWYGDRSGGADSRFAPGQERQCMSRCLQQRTRQNCGELGRCAAWNVERLASHDFPVVLRAIPPRRLAVGEAKGFGDRSLHVVVAAPRIPGRPPRRIQLPGRDDMVTAST